MKLDRLSESGRVEWIDFEFSLSIERPLVIYDTETTGVSAKDDRIIQFAGLRLQPNKSGKALLLNSLIHPGVGTKIPKQATDIHGITDEDVADKPVFGEVAKELAMFMSGADHAGFNVTFDFDMMYNHFTRCLIDLPWPSDVQLLDAYPQFVKDYPHTLAQAMLHYTGEELEDAHDALGDIVGTAAVLDAQAVLHDWDQQPIKDVTAAIREPFIDPARKFYKDDQGKVVVGFGNKHKGKHLHQVFAQDRGYVRWMKDNLPFLSVLVLKHYEQIFYKQSR